MRSKKKVLIFALLFIFLILGLSFYQSYLSGRNYYVVSTSPSDNQASVPVRTSIYVIFSRDLTPKEREAVEAAITPTVQVSTLWVNDRQIMISPDSVLEYNKRYSFRLSYAGNQTFSSIFTTVELPTRIDDASVSEAEVADQHAGDIEFGESMERFLEKYPFWAQLPIEQPEYRIVYDLEEEKFRIRLKIPSSSDQATKDRILSTALSRLRIIGVTVSDNYYVLYSD